MIAYLGIPSPYTEMAELLLLKDPDWIAPQLWRSELRNVLALYLNPWVQGGYRVHDIDFTVESKNLSFTQRLSGHFLNRCGIKSSPKAPTFGVLCAGMNPRIQVVFTPVTHDL